MEFPGMPPACPEAGTGASQHALLAATLLDLHFLQRQNYLSLPASLSQDFFSWTLGIHFQAFDVSLYFFLLVRTEYCFFFFHFILVNLYPHHFSEISKADFAAIFISQNYPFFHHRICDLGDLRLQSGMWQFWAHQCKRHSGALAAMHQLCASSTFIVVMAISGTYVPCAFLYTCKRIERSQPSLKSLWLPVGTTDKLACVRFAIFPQILHKALRCCTLYQSFILDISQLWTVLSCVDWICSVMPD